MRSSLITVTSVHYGQSDEHNNLVGKGAFYENFITAFRKGKCDQ